MSLLPQASATLGGILRAEQPLGTKEPFTMSLADHRQTLLEYLALKSTGVAPAAEDTATAGAQASHGANKLTRRILRSVWGHSGVCGAPTLEDTGRGDGWTLGKGA